MKNLCDIGKEVAREFGFTESEVSEMIRFEPSPDESASQLTSLFHDPEFILAEQRAVRIHEILSSPLIAESLPEDCFDAQSINTIVGDPKLLSHIIEMYESSVQTESLHVSAGLHRVIRSVVRNCVKQNLVHDVVAITRISIRCRLANYRYNLVEEIASLGLAYLSRHFHLLNDDDKRTLADDVEKLIARISQLQDQKSCETLGPAFCRWGDICREIRANN